MVMQRAWTMNQSVDHQNNTESVSVKMPVCTISIQLAAFNLLILINQQLND